MEAKGEKTVKLKRMSYNYQKWQGCGGGRYTHTLLVGLQISAATLESSMEIPQKPWNGTTI